MATSPTTSSADPPYYVLVAQSHALNNPNALPGPTSLSHPVIEYHYADDRPEDLLPQDPDQHVLVLDYDPGSLAAPTVRSLSHNLVVSALKITDAPGAAVAGEPALRNNSMYVIETTTKPADGFVCFSSAPLSPI